MGTKKKLTQTRKKIEHTKVMLREGENVENYLKKIYIKIYYR